jgi:hypothetical protein
MVVVVVFFFLPYIPKMKVCLSNHESERESEIERESARERAGGTPITFEPVGRFL